MEKKKKAQKDAKRNYDLIVTKKVENVLAFGVHFDSEKHLECVQ